MANQRHVPRSTRGFDDEVDERQFVNRSGVSSEFDNYTDDNGVTISSNAHDERGYEHMPSLPDQATYRSVRNLEGEWLGEQKITSDPPMSIRVKNQVFNSIGDRVGTMTSASLLKDDRGEGRHGADGGLQSRTEVRPAVEPLILNKAPKQGRYR
jgi:hypothetical protein